MLLFQAQQAEAQALTEERMKILALEKQTQEQMINKALTVDSKWIREVTVLVISSSIIDIGVMKVH